MAAEFELYNDVVNGRLVLGLSNTGTFTFPDLFQGSSLGIKYYPCRPTNSAIPPFFSLLAIDSLTLEIGIGPRAGTEALLAYQNTWTPSGTYLDGDLNINTTPMNTAIGVLDQLATYMEIRLSDGGDARTVYQTGIKIIAAVIGPTGEVALPGAADQYYTKAEMDMLFVKWINSNIISRGKPITLYSANGSAQRLIGVSNTGEATDDIVI